MKKALLSLLLMAALISSASYAQEQREVSKEELVTTLQEAASISQAAVAVRNSFSNDGIAAENFVREISALQKRCVPIVVLIATTNPPREIQRLAMTVAIGVKGVELGLWYYIYGVMSNEADFIKYGDSLLNQGHRALQTANTLLEG